LNSTHEHTWAIRWESDDDNRTRIGEQCTGCWAMRMRTFAKRAAADGTTPWGPVGEWSEVPIKGGLP